MPSAIRRRTPEELLQQFQAEEDYERRGRLKVFLGYASGVGKSFRMLDEGRRRRNADKMWWWAQSSPRPRLRSKRF